MSDELSDKLQSILQNPELMGAFSSLLEGGTDSGSAAGEQSDEFASIQKIIGGMKNTNDRRISLLNALKPYMRPNRAGSIDKAIKMIRLSKIGSIMKDI